MTAGSTARQLRTAAIIAVAIVWLAPVVWIVATAFKAPRDTLSPSLWFTPTLQNFVTAFGAPYFLGGRLLNSVLVSVGTLVVSIPVATAAAYAFSRFRFPGGQIWPLGLQHLDCRRYDHRRHGRAHVEIRQHPNAESFE